MIETRGIKRARDLRERQSSGQLEVSQYYTKTYQRRVSTSRGRGRKISQYQLCSPPENVHLIIPHMLNGNHMHCNVGAYSRNSEILYIFLTSYTLVSGYTLMLIVMAYCVLVIDMATISITIIVRIQILDLIMLAIIFVLVMICLRTRRETVEEGRFQAKSDSEEDNTNVVEDEYFSIVEDEELTEHEVYALYAEFYDRICDDELQKLDNYLERD